MKRVLSLVLAVSMVLSMFTFSFAGSELTDISGTEYEAAVDALVELGVVAGYPDGTYLPEKAVSRAEMAKLLVVAAGLESAAEISEGTTKFSDVEGGWQSGYVNVASEYGYIAGYPDGTFRPDAQVTYSEAVTMVLRVLGYRTVIESKGTWPTNYISKASDLKLLNDITIGKYTDGATRGNVALLIWNMLRTDMWDVTSENETNGLNYSAKDLMLNIKFPDYSYSKAEFDGFTINKDGEVIVKLDDDYDKKYEGSLEDTEYEYLSNDFYTFVEGTEVEVLVNEKDGTLLTMVPTGRDTLKEGTKAELDDDYDALQKVAYDYAYAIIEKKDIAESTQLTVDSEYVYEVKENSKNVKINTTTYDDKKYEDSIVLIDGERASLRDVEEGSVLSKVTVNKNEFFVVSSETAEGKFTKYVEKDYENSKTYMELTIAGEAYTEATKAGKLAATYVEDPDDDKEKETKLLSSASESVRKDMKNEEVVAYLDFLGRVARLDFDGNIGDDSSSEVAFYSVTANVENPSSRVYTIGLANVNGDDEYTFEKGSSVGKTLYNEDIEGSFVAVTFNDDEEITDIVVIARATSGAPYVSGDQFVYDEEEVKGYYQLVDLGDHADFDDDEEAVVAGRNSYLVDDDTILVTVVYDDNGTTKTSDDEYTVEFAEGVDAVSNIKDERVLVIYDADEKIVYAKYVVRFDDATNRDDTLTGKLETARKNKLGEYTLTIDGEEYIYRTSDNDLGAAITSYEDGVIVFTLKTNKDDDEEYVQFVSGVKASEAVNDGTMDDYVDEVSGKIVGFEIQGATNVTGKAFQDDFDGFVVVKVDVNDDKTIDSDEIVVDVKEAIKCEDITANDFTKGDRIIKDLAGEVIYIISGMEERETPIADAIAEATVEEMATEATEYEYEDGYKYSGEFVVDGSTVEFVISSGDANAAKDGVSVFSADTARFLGGLYRESGVEKISYDDVDYTWVTEGEGVTELKGSNWRAADNTTLVKVLRDAQKAGTTSFELTLDDELTLNYVLVEPEV